MGSVHGRGVRPGRVKVQIDNYSLGRDEKAIFGQLSASHGCLAKKIRKIRMFCIWSLCMLLMSHSAHAQ